MESPFDVPTLGPARYDSPLVGFLGVRRTNEHYVSEDDRVLLADTLSLLDEGAPASFEPGGPRRRVFFRPGDITVGIVTCGGLCPGLNDVVRGLVNELFHHYAIRRCIGFRYGYAGLVADGPNPVDLTPHNVIGINEQGGTILGTSRGAQDCAAMADRLQDLGVDILFVIGGDGSMRGAAALSAELTARGAPIGVIGIPKTIDNDIPWIGQSFGFQTAYTVAADHIRAAAVEAHSARNGVGLVRVMGRHAGFIACYAALAAHEADLVLIPEVPFDLPTVLQAVHDRIDRQGSAVVVVAEGAGQELTRPATADASGNAGLGNIGTLLSQALKDSFTDAGKPLTLKYLDPGYAIRSVPAAAADSVYCVRLAQAAAHAGMAGRTAMVVGRRHNRFIHVPIDLVVSGHNGVATDGDLWLSVLETTGQPAVLCA